MEKNKFLKCLKNNTALIQIILIPLVFVILPIMVPQKPAYCAYVLFIMTFYWITECVPIAITSLLPVFLFPLFGILSSKLVSQIYFQDILMLYFGGLIMAISVESTGLHKRIAFKVILLFGSNPLWLLLGIMSVTGFLSLWISNVASASMMLPIVISVVKQIARLDETFSVEPTSLKNSNNNDSSINMNNIDKSIPESQNLLTQDVSIAQSSNKTGPKLAPVGEDEMPQTKAAANLMKAFCLSITYSSSIGGCGSVVGTAPNLILKRYFDENYSDAGLNFFSFMLYSIPIQIMMLVFTWLTLGLIWLPKKYIFMCKKSKEDDKNAKKPDALKEYIKNEYKKLGPVSWEEGSVAGLFLFLVLLWVTRDPNFVNGWSYFFPKGFVTDTTPALLLVFLLSAWPKENIFKGKPYKNLISWPTINKNMPWTILILSGGCLAIAEGFDKSLLSKWIGTALKNIMPTQKALALFVILVLALLGTEFISNTSMSTIFIPIADSLSRVSRFDACYILLPLGLGTSYAFQLPVATPTNAIIFKTGYVTIKDMVISGIALKIFGLCILFLSVTWIQLIFKSTVTPLISTTAVYNATTLASLASSNFTTN